MDPKKGEGQKFSKREDLSKETRTVVTFFVGNYRKELEDRLYLINSVEDLEKIHKIVVKKVSEDIKKRLPLKSAEWMESFISETNRLFEYFKTKILEKIENLNKKYLTALNVAKDHYIDGMSHSLEAKDFLSIEELNKIHKQFRVSALKVYESHFEGSKSYDLLHKNYESALKESIDEEFQKIFDRYKQNPQTDGGKALIFEDYEIKVIQSKESYKQRMNEIIGDDKYMTDEELQEFNKTIKDEIISELTKQLNPSIHLEIVNFIEDLKQFISVEFQTYLLKNLTNRLNINKDIQSISQKYVNEYKRRIDRTFDLIQSVEEFKSHHSIILEEVLQCSRTSNDFENEKFLQYQQKQIENTISEIFRKNLSYFCEKKNDENKLILEQNLNKFKGIIEQKYSLKMNSVVDSVCSESDLNTKHKEIMEELLIELKDGFQLMDTTLEESYQQKLHEFMNNELIALKKKLNEKLEKIIKSYKKCSKDLISDYFKEMENNIRKEYFFYDESFEGLHSVYSNYKIDKFEKHCKNNPCSETQSHLIKFKQTIDKESIKLKERFQMKKDLKLQKLEIALKDIKQLYMGEMKVSTNNIRTMEDLKKCHQNVKEKQISIFKESHRFRDESKITPYIKRLDEILDHSLTDFEDILELRIQKIETLTKNLRLDVRRYYKEEMKKCLKNKKFVPKYLLIKCHNFLVKNTIEKFRPEKGELTEESFKQLVEESITDIFAKIEEENQMMRTTESPAIGIDLGTTNSCVAFFNPDSRNPNHVVVIPNELGHPTTPSVVSYRDNSIVSVGEVAKDEIHSYPKNTISSVKRLIGRHFAEESVQKDMELWSYNVVDDNNIPKVSVKVDGQDQVLYPEQISAKVLAKMKKIAENHLVCEVTKAVITVPAYFSDGQKQATKDAGRLAGLEVLRIINEPTAAAIAFKVDRNEETEIRNVLIFDFGGGTFDVSILEINRGKIIVRAVGGDNHLGGDDFDTNIVKYCLEEFYKECNVRVEGEEGEMAMCRLRNKCEENKKKLSVVESTVISIDNFYKRNDLRVVLTRDKFEELNHHLFVRSIDLVKETIESKEIRRSDIDDVVLVGGSTRIPKIQEMLSQFFGVKPLNHWLNPDEAVAKGAAIHAAYLNGQQMDEPTQLEDVNPLSLGIEIVGFEMSVIIPRNSPVPTTITQQYFTVHDYQTVVNIKIFEGEKKKVKNNHLLGQFELSGIPSALARKEPIDVTFSINDEGILHVNAKIRSTGGKKELKITEHTGRLTEEMIKKLFLQETPFNILFK